jgi:nucleoside-diphosphate-sugar epimerase
MRWTPKLSVVEASRMSDSPTILVTGATGNLGTAVCRALLARGHSVRATDLRFKRGFPTRVELGDLRDELFVHRMVEGTDTVVHLGNHPNQFAGPSPQGLLGDNVRMNANVFLAAQSSDVRTIVFSSSVQVMIRREDHFAETRTSIPCLPLDGDLPPNPGKNTYALSKEFGERMLRLMVESDPALSATAIRFPMLVTDGLVRRFESMRRTPQFFVDFAGGLAHLFLSDAGSLVADVVEHRLPGYHQYFPARDIELRGYQVADVIREWYSEVELRRPLAELDSLIDISAITRELGWVPHERLSVELDR